MEKIASFSVDHDKLTEGIYVSRIDDDIVTYDLRTRIPNNDEYMDNITLHSVEHMFATYARNSVLAKNVIYFGPMGCQTGFYLVMRGVQDFEVLVLVKTVLQDIIDHKGPMPGGKKAECGNFKNLSVAAAKIEARRYLKILNSKENDFKYNS
ncbi:MAG: S-ribosylhomocysteine lyase [Clostridiales bacterium]|nr:MAG: S-ribosylhomocysteine lyase [Clostridiales bacterium]